MRVLLTSALLVLFGLTPANATLIASFSENPSATPTIVATDNGTTTHITASDPSTQLTSFFGGSTISNARFLLSATSVDPVTTLGTLVFQHYQGTFCFSGGPACSGTDYLSGSFTDASFGALGGQGLTLNVSSPPDTLVLSSDVVPASELQSPSTFNLTFANLAPLLHIHGTTIAGFTADFSGTASASSQPVSEPASAALLGLGLLGLGLIRLKNQS